MPHCFPNINTDTSFSRIEDAIKYKLKQDSEYYTDEWQNEGMIMYFKNMQLQEKQEMGNNKEYYARFTKTPRNYLCIDRKTGDTLIEEDNIPIDLNNAIDSVVNRYYNKKHKQNDTIF